MKKIVLSTSLFISTIISSHAQIYIPNGAVQSSGNNNVGIGIAAPGEKLHVIGNGLFTGQIKSSNGTFGGTLNLGDVAFLTSSFDGYAKLVYNMHNGSGYSNIMSVNGNGYVGIGTSAPTALLDVYTKLPSPGTYTNQNWTTDHLDYNLKLQTVWNNDGINQQFIQKYNGVDYTALSFFAGKVGIGTSKPMALLDVYTKLPSQGTYTNQYWTTDNPDYSLKLQTVWNNDGINQQFIQKYNGVDYTALSFFAGKVGIGTSKPMALLDVYTKLPSQGTYTNQYWTTDNPNYSLKLQTIWNNDGINQQFIQKYNDVDYTALSFFAGKVGIGTAKPDEKLTVNGNIHAKEVKIDLSIPAPDYVFASDYKLKSLQEVEEYIKQNSHLPEIPSAKEIEKKGLLLAEMNMSLLKKVEELTLYIIEQNKRIEKLEMSNK